MNKLFFFSKNDHFSMCKTSYCSFEFRIIGFYIYHSSCVFNCMPFTPHPIYHGIYYISIDSGRRYFINHSCRLHPVNFIEYTFTQASQHYMLFLRNQNHATVFVGPLYYICAVSESYLISRLVFIGAWEY